jgi:hypothetical protein
MTDEELAVLFRYHVTLMHRYKDSGGWDYEQEYCARNPGENVWDHYVHRTYLESVKILVEKLEGEVDRETIIKVIKAL